MSTPDSGASAVARPWRETFHEYVRGDYGKCALCHVAADRAIHSQSYALHNGYEWIEAK